MRIKEIFFNRDQYIPKDREISNYGKDRGILSQEDASQGRLNHLKAKIERGLMPEIRDASYAIGYYSWGDLKELGWAEKEQEPAGGSFENVRWIYKGPKPIRLLSSGNNIVMKPGDATEWTEVDYS